MRECDSLIRPALEEALDSFEIEKREDHCRVVTPFSHSFGDLIAFGIQNDRGDIYRLSDFGETFAMLDLYGVGFTSDKQTKRMNKIESMYELETLDGEIALTCPRSELHQGIISIIGAIEAVSHLLYTHQSRQKSRFKSKVKVFLRDHEYDFESNYTVTGENQSRDFDFGINHREPRVLLDTIHASREWDLDHLADSVYVNSVEIQSKDYEHGVIVDDLDGEYNESKLSTLQSNLDYFFTWKSRGDLVDQIPI